MSYNTNEVIRRGTGSRSQKRMVGLLRVVFWVVYLLDKGFQFLKWISQFFGE